jgi:hypothetical protein
MIVMGWRLDPITVIVIGSDRIEALLLARGVEALL